MINHDQPMIYQWLTCSSHVLQLLHHPPRRHRLVAQHVRPRQHHRGGGQGPPRQERRASLGVTEVRDVSGEWKIVSWEKG